MDRAERRRAQSGRETGRSGSLARRRGSVACPGSRRARVCRTGAKAFGTGVEEEESWFRLTTREERT